MLGRETYLERSSAREDNFAKADGAGANQHFTLGQTALLQKEPKKEEKIRNMCFTKQLFRCLYFSSFFLFKGHNINHKYFYVTLSPDLSFSYSAMMTCSSSKCLLFDIEEYIKIDSLLDVMVD
jgi:hypothetical protein